MQIYEVDLDIPVAAGHRDLFSHFQEEIGARLPVGAVPVRLAVTSTDSAHYHCEVGVIGEAREGSYEKPRSIFEFRRREQENTDKFTAVMLVPTGINCEIGGHAGDAGPAASLLASVCDRLITHPNTVNASDVNQLPANGLYVEGSVICRFLQGTVALQPVRSNRVLMVMDDHPLKSFRDSTINALNAGRAAYGLNCSKIVVLDRPVRLKASYTASGRATGTVEGMENLLRVVEREQGTFDAIALAGQVEVPIEFHHQYFDSDGDMVNPWGGVEAIYTHTLSLLTDVPSAHAPMTGSLEAAQLEPGVVDPRMAAEIISSTYLQCVLIGLQRSPKIIPNPHEKYLPGSIGAADVSCLVIPEGVLGLPVMAALEQGMTVIAVRENRNLMRNDLSLLPWADGQYLLVDNYLEAAGVMAAMKAGLSLDTIRRPICPAIVESHRAGQVGLARQLHVRQAG